MSNPETTAKPSMWQRSTIGRFCRWTVRCIRWSCSGPGIRRIVIVIAWTITTIGLAYGIEDWHGRHLWNKYLKEATARGEHLDYAYYIPKEIPDEENFAATPFIKSLFPNGGKQFDDAFNKADNEVAENQKDKGHRHFIPLVAYQQALNAIKAGTFDKNAKYSSDKQDLESRAAAAPVVLEALQTNEAMFDELRAASSRPNARYPVVYKLDDPYMTLVPHLGRMKGIVRRLEFKSSAELALGQSDKALDDVMLALYLGDSVKDEPFMISYLVRIACLQITVQPVWEGLAEHHWTDAQLRQLQAKFESYNFLADMKNPVDAERATGAFAADFARNKGLGSTLNLMSFNNQNGMMPSSAGQKIVNTIGLLIPSGWYYQEKTSFCRGFDGLLAGTTDPTAKTVSPHRIGANRAELERRSPHGFWNAVQTVFFEHRLIALTLTPNMGNFVNKAAMAQVTADQAAIACALERYRLANGQYPDSLDALTPQFIAHLPNDVMSGEPYKYRLNNDGQFVLYSVGWDQKDGGGVPGKNSLFDDVNADWVWSYPAK